MRKFTRLLALLASVALICSMSVIVSAAGEPDAYCTGWIDNGILQEKDEIIVDVKIDDTSIQQGCSIPMYCGEEHSFSIELKEGYSFHPDGRIYAVFASDSSYHQIAYTTFNFKKKYCFRNIHFDNRRFE